MIRHFYQNQASGWTGTPQKLLEIQNWARLAPDQGKPANAWRRLGDRLHRKRSHRLYHTIETEGT